MNAAASARHSLRRRLRAALAGPEQGTAARERLLAAQFFASPEPGACRVLPLPKSRARM
ncbi:MAG: hypothetical protein IPI67_17475 [Myxococcales bacterium]|nr:hypothetical protein [Myxococcales bacterium]